MTSEIGPASLPFVNPFEESIPLPAAGLPEDLLGRTALTDPLLPEAPKGEHVISAAVQDAAKKVCDHLSDVMMLPANTAAPKVELPHCSDIAIVQAVLDRLERSPVALGWGEIPPRVVQTWAKFMNQAADDYRQERNLGKSELTPLELTIPEWLRSASFDLLNSCRLLDVTINGDIQGKIAERAQFCRITINGDVVDTGSVGASANRSNFIINGDMWSQRSFHDASNVNISIKGSLAGIVGYLSESRIACSGEFTGGCLVRGSECVTSSNITPERSSY
jgi:hypothetical protein